MVSLPEGAGVGGEASLVAVRGTRTGGEERGRGAWRGEARERRALQRAAWSRSVRRRTSGGGGVNTDRRAGVVTSGKSGDADSDCLRDES